MPKRVIIHEGSIGNGEPDNKQSNLRPNVSTNPISLTRNDDNEDNVRDGIAAKRNVTISDDTTKKEDFDTHKNILEQNVFKEKSWVEETKEGCV